MRIISEIQISCIIKDNELKSNQKPREASLSKIITRSHPQGDFSAYNGEHFRPDITALAVLALEATQVDQKLSYLSCRRLSSIQNSKDRISVMENYPKSFSYTSLAILAWAKLTGFEQEMDRAKKFLLKNTGKHWPQKKSPSKS
ncbi:MAG: hypothetical protein JSV73_05485 [Flavobacteriaceae bacterium]|nr:MAG: hypothetical protein JSV73_05485 [Flavobacteriaceae bacterium]